MRIKEKLVQLVYDTTSIIFTAVIIIMVVFTFFFRIAGVIGPSMIPTLHDGDKLVVSAFIAEPQAGDVIIITQPNAFHEPIVKRIVGMPGQEVDIDFIKGLVYIDGNLMQENYVQGSTTDRFDIDFPVTVPDGSVFVMGDNRNHSTDSRSSQIGFVDENYILGKVVGRIYPTGSWWIR
jgi:signal peptidase I